MEHLHHECAWNRVENVPLKTTVPLTAWNQNCNNYRIIFTLWFNGKNIRTCKRVNGVGQHLTLIKVPFTSVHLSNTQPTTHSADQDCQRIMSNGMVVTSSINSVLSHATTARSSNHYRNLSCRLSRQIPIMKNRSKKSDGAAEYGIHNYVATAIASRKMRRKAGTNLSWGHTSINPMDWKQVATTPGMRCWITTLNYEANQNHAPKIPQAEYAWIWRALNFNLIKPPSVRSDWISWRLGDTNDFALDAAVNGMLRQWNKENKTDTSLPVPHSTREQTFVPSQRLRRKHWMNISVTLGSNAQRPCHRSRLGRYITQIILRLWG